MRTAAMTTMSLERCAQAAGYAAVSSCESDEIVVRRRDAASTGAGYWRAALVFILLVI